MLLDTPPQPIHRHESTQPNFHRRRRVAGIVLGLLVFVLVARAVWPDRQADVRSGTSLVDVAGMASRYGIQVNLIATSAAGGLIELRYQVIDPEKASPMLHDVQMLPKIIDEDSGTTLAMASLPHRHSSVLTLGGEYFFLLANAHNALRAGSQVTLVIGDARIEHLTVQG